MNIKKDYKDAYVYALVDPRTKEIRYIGCTTNPKQRYWSHKHLSSDWAASILKQEWIIELRDLGLVPLFAILEKIPFDNRAEIETQWMNFYKDKVRLTNIRDGYNRPLSQNLIRLQSKRNV